MTRLQGAALRCIALLLGLSAVELLASRTLGRFRGTLSAEAMLALCIGVLVCAPNQLRELRLTAIARGVTGRVVHVLAGGALAFIVARIALHEPGTAPAQAWLVSIAFAAAVEELLFRDLLPDRLASDLPSPLAMVASQACFALAHLAALPAGVAASRVPELFLAGTVLIGVRSLLGLWACVFLHATLNVQALSSLGAPPWYDWSLTATLGVGLALLSALGKRRHLRVIFSPRCPANPASIPPASAMPSPADRWTSRPS